MNPTPFNTDNREEGREREKGRKVERNEGWKKRIEGRKEGRKYKTLHLNLFLRFRKMGIELLGLSLESSMESLDLNDPKRIRNHVTDVSMDSNGGSQDGSKLYKNSNEGSEDGSESYKDSNEGSDDGSESFKDSNEGSEDVSESNKDSNEESQDGSGFSKDSNQESDEGSKGCMSSNERCKSQIGFSFDR